MAGHDDGPPASLVLFLRDRRPGCIRVETFHLFEFVLGFGSKVLLVNDTAVADQKGPYTRYFVLSGCGDKCKAADHDSLHYKIHFAEWHRRALSVQDLEKITMVRLRATRIALFNCSGDVFTNRTTPRAIGVLPR